MMTTMIIILRGRDLQLLPNERQCLPAERGYYNIGHGGCDLAC
jgi:hypothetical protein